MYGIMALITSLYLTEHLTSPRCIDTLTQFPAKANVIQQRRGTCRRQLWTRQIDSPLPFRISSCPTFNNEFSNGKQLALRGFFAKKCTCGNFNSSTYEKFPESVKLACDEISKSSSRRCLWRTLYSRKTRPRAEKFSFAFSSLGPSSLNFHQSHTKWTRTHQRTIRAIYFIIVALCRNNPIILSHSRRHFFSSKRGVIHFSGENYSPRETYFLRCFDSRANETRPTRCVQSRYVSEKKWAEKSYFLPRWILKRRQRNKGEQFLAGSLTERRLAFSNDAHGIEIFSHIDGKWHGTESARDFGANDVLRTIMHVYRDKSCSPFIGIRGFRVKAEFTRESFSRINLALVGCRDIVAHAINAHLASYAKQPMHAFALEDMSVIHIMRYLIRHREIDPSPALDFFRRSVSNCD